jgi:hypothetical protein
MKAGRCIAAGGIAHGRGVAAASSYGDPSSRRCPSGLGRRSLDDRGQGILSHYDSYAGLVDPEVASRCGHPLWRLRRVALRGAALSPIFSRAPTHGPAGGGPAGGGRGGARHRRRQARDRLARAAARGHPIFLYLHGNGGSLQWRAERFRSLTADGSGLVALSYRGYGGSSGRPTETGLIEDAAAYAFAIARYPAERIVLWGESLGSAVALALAAERPVGRLVLDAPFHFGRRRRRTALLVRASAALHEGPVSLGCARQQGHRTSAGGGWSHSGPDSSVPRLEQLERVNGAATGSIVWHGLADP